MNYAEDTKEITLRKCDLHAILVMLTKNDRDTLEVTWMALENFRRSL